MPCAGKTGTTNGSKDGWFVGYTPYYTTSIWVGYDIPRTLNGLAGATYPGHIWQNYMKQIHQGLAVKKFEKPIKVYGKKEKDISEDEAKKAEKELKDKKNQDKVNIDLNRDDPDRNTNKDDQNNNNNNTNTETNNNGDNTNNNNSGDENNGDNADNNTDLPDLPPEDERDDVE
jgi:membrane carboxypeptidase/penicillin-binding protein